MEWLALIGAAFKIVLKILDALFDRNKERREKKKKVIKDAKKAIKSGNVSAVNRAINRGNRL